MNHYQKVSKFASPEVKWNGYFQDVRNFKGGGAVEFFVTKIGKYSIWKGEEKIGRLGVNSNQIWTHNRSERRVK